MKKLALLSMAVLGTVGAANAQSMDVEGLNLTLERNWSLSESYSRPGTDDAVAYSNLSTFSGQATLNGGSTAGITRLQADLLNFANWSPGADINRIVFSVANLNSAATSARARLRFYADNAGTPGAILAGFSFNPISFAVGGNLFFFDPGVLPIPANGKMWAGMTFDNVGTTTTDAELNNLGQLLFNPPTIGSSDDMMFATTAAGSFFGANPAGATFNFGGNPVANAGWEFEAVPEPGTIAALGLGAAVLLRRRKK